MKIIVVGCGKVGAALTAQLSQEGHDIAVIDVDSRVVTDISNNYDVLGLVGKSRPFSGGDGFRRTEPAVLPHR